MKQLLIVISILGLFACQTEPANNKGSNPATTDVGTENTQNVEIANRKIYTSFNKFDVVNKLLPGNLSNATQAQVDLKDLVRRNKDFSLQPILSVERIKDIFPENLGNMTRKDYNGEENSLLGSPTTFVKAEYRLGDMVARISFIDSGAHPGVIVGIANWADRIIEKKEDKFEEYTKTFGGFPAYERVIYKSNANVFEYIVDNRWVISIQSIKIPIDLVHKLAGSLNIDKLRSLAKG